MFRLHSVYTELLRKPRGITRPMLDRECCKSDVPYIQLTVMASTRQMPISATGAACVSINVITY